MNIDELVAQTRSIMKTHYEGMQRLQMGESDPMITKEDLCQQLQSFKPSITHTDLAPLYHTLEEKGYATLITNDTITFSKDFVA